MILILSEHRDCSTDDVIDWINHFGGSFVRLNQEELIQNITISDGKFLLKVKDVLIDLTDIHVFWHRRGDPDYQYLHSKEFISRDKEIQKHLMLEWITLKDFLFYQLWKRQGIFNKNLSLNKLILSATASDLGLMCPQYIITGENNVELFKQSITKPLSDGFVRQHENSIETCFTEKIDCLNYDEFFVSLIQECIKPAYEVRTIIVKNKVWSMSIHDLSMASDYRKSYGSHRYCPYLLPDDIQEKLIVLCRKFELDFGAADFIVDTKGNHFLLEINPFGQFGMVSFPCNYPIEQEIAKILISYDN